jgi:putative transposase
MARFARVVIVDVPHHVTQRGNARQVILGSDADRVTYLGLLAKYSQLHGVALLGYCLMSNHVHLIAVPHAPDGLAQALKQAHGRYASYWNARQSSSGHAWQGRFYSCPLDESHLWKALRYVELNPVRAGMVEVAEQWPWSSAAVHCGVAVPDTILEMKRWSQRWTPAQWVEFLAAEESPTDLRELRRSTHTGRPLGTPEFVEALEKLSLRPLAARKAGRRARPGGDKLQAALTFVA